MSILVFIVFGFIIGLIARAIMPGSQRMGFLTTTLVGIGGSFIGGFLAALITKQRVLELNTAGFIGSVLGAIILLAAMGGLSRRRLA
jgi:uncharacterized membrane protein YeaQ/YmgE (transglycosylase-associated protein family)